MGTPQVPFATAGPNYRRSLLTAAAVGVLGLIVFTVSHDYAAGVLICVGLGLGALNSGWIARSAALYASQSQSASAPPRGRIIGGVFWRLIAITAAALLFAFAVHPGGWGVAAGLAAFQTILVLYSLAPMLREVRRT